MEKLKIASRLHGNPTGEPQFPQQVKNAAGQRLSVACPKATRSMVALMDMQAVIGGAASHFGGPAAFAEIMSATHGLMFDKAEQARRPWHEMFHFINDAGHCENGIYALKANYQVANLTIDSLKGFRSIESSLTGHGEAHLFPESVYISNGPLGSGLPQAQGLAAAESYEEDPRITITAISDGACMEGEAKESLSAIPGLAAKKRLGPFVCMVSDNNTKLSGRIDDDSFSMKPTFESLSAMGWNVVFVEDGHNLQKVFNTIEKACEQAKKDPTKPQFLWFKTIKGKGVASTEESASGGHGFPLKKADALQSFIEEIYAGEKMPEPLKQWAIELTHLSKPQSNVPKAAGERGKVQLGVSEALSEMYEKNYPVVSVSADLQGSTGVAGFRKKYPQASFEVGVAESNMVSMAVGFSKQGYIPFVDTFAQFGVTKGSLPLIMSGLSQGPIMAVYSHTGFQDAADGASHQALTYIAMLSAIPNVDVVCLTCAEEAKALVSQAIENFAKARNQGQIPRSTVFFLGRENYPLTFSESASYQYGKAQVLVDSSGNYKKSVTLIGVGSMLENTLMAAQQLAEQGVGSVVINPSMINHPDLDTIQGALSKTEGRMVIVEDHRDIGGFASILSHKLALGGVDIKLKSLGVQDHFGRSAYSADQLYEKFGLGMSDIVEAAQSL